MSSSWSVEQFLPCLCSCEVLLVFLLSLACSPSGITPSSAWFLHWGYIIDETATCDCATLSNTQSISEYFLLTWRKYPLCFHGWLWLLPQFAQVPWTECWRKRHLDAISRPRRQLYHYWSGPKFQGLFLVATNKPPRQSEGWLQNHFLLRTSCTLACKALVIVSW